ncbi:MAG: class I SAM-dependent methyltransferase [Actinomycetota bacterium]
MGTGKRIAQVIGGTGAAIAAVAVARHLAPDHMPSRQVPGGILMDNAGRYDAMSGLFLSGFFAGVAADVARIAPPGGRVLEVGCGPGRLAVPLARQGLDVTGLDLDPAMIDRARINAERAFGTDRRLSFVVGDAAALAFPDGSFDLVVSTMSMHHWEDPAAGLREIARVLRPGGRALVWDLRPGVVPFHAHVPDVVEQVEGSGLRVASAAPWRWPWMLRLTQRVELVPADAQVPAAST